ncbi:MAG: aminotransferase class III-fold pyridoxal phosphate-dependent enzyme, partial [Thermoplasmata archaeon]|nr:aminotransferase class III-fold pyridoxal phosphate-dependent enzyme [Thermoplasmata archaeon]
MPEPKPESPVEGSNYTGWRRQADWHPVTIARAEGSTFWDASGRPFLDFASQLVAVNLGHRNPAVLGAMRAQAEELAYISPSFSSEGRARLSGLLDEVVPTGLRRYFFGSTGTEANESALLIARLVTGRRKVISRPRSYHGSTAASLSASGDLRRSAVEAVQSVPGTVFAPDCYCYRCPLGLRYPDCQVACATEVGKLLEVDDDIAAMIVEPVVGTNGVIVPVPEYLPMIRKTTRDHGVLLIADEVMTGWGRTGEWFAVD